jgi:hypothetical protein
MPTLVWEQDGAIYHATARSVAGIILYHLVVEQMGAEWTWNVWRPGESFRLSRYGVATTIQEAMRAAEDAAQ